MHMNCTDFPEPCQKIPEIGHDGPQNRSKLPVFADRRARKSRKIDTAPPLPIADKSRKAKIQICVLMSATFFVVETDYICGTNDKDYG